MKIKSSLLLLSLFGFSTFAQPVRRDVKVGGHFNLAIPVVTYGATTKSIAKDYTKVGLAPGVTYKLNEYWGLDLEFVAYNNFMTPGMSSLVVDPGVIYNFGAFTGGLRLAVDVAAAQNFGLIPIVVKTFPVGLVDFLIELDVPVFMRGNGTDVSIQPQIGVAF